MKKLTLLLSILVLYTSFGQTRYWTSYNFTVEPQNEAAVYKLVDDYFKSNPTSENINAYLYENHFKDNANEYDGYIVLTDGCAPKPTSCIKRRCWVLLPNYRLAFTHDNTDVVVNMTK